MPFIRKDTTVYKKLPDGTLVKKGSSKTVKRAKRYVKALYANTREMKEEAKINKIAHKTSRRKKNG